MAESNGDEVDAVFGESVFADASDDADPVEDGHRHADESDEVVEPVEGADFGESVEASGAEGEEEVPYAEFGYAAVRELPGEEYFEYVDVEDECEDYHAACHGEVEEAVGDVAVDAGDALLVVVEGECEEWEYEGPGEECEVVDDVDGEYFEHGHFDGEEGECESDGYGECFDGGPGDGEEVFDHHSVAGVVDDPDADGEESYDGVEGCGMAHVDEFLFAASDDEYDGDGEYESVEVAEFAAFDAYGVGDDGDGDEDHVAHEGGIM